MNMLRLHLPSIPHVQKRMDRAASHPSRIKNPNPFSHMSASIAASQKRRLVKGPKYYGKTKK